MSNKNQVKPTNLFSRFKKVRQSCTLLPRLWYFLLQNWNTYFEEGYILTVWDALDKFLKDQNLMVPYDEEEAKTIEFNYGEYKSKYMRTNLPKQSYLRKVVVEEQDFEEAKRIKEVVKDDYGFKRRN